MEKSSKMSKNKEKTIKNIKKSSKILNNRNKSVKNIEKRLKMSKNRQKYPQIKKNFEEFIKKL